MPRDIAGPPDAATASGAISASVVELFEAAPFGVYLVDADFRLAAISAGCGKVFSGIDPLIGRDLAAVLRIVWPEPFATEAIDRFRHTLATGEPYHSPDTTEQRANIAVVESYDWQISRVTMPDGRYGVVCYFYETTERVHAAQDARFQSDLAEQIRIAERTERLIADVCAALGRFLRLDRCFMVQIEESRDRASVTGDYYDGIPSLAGEHRISDYAAAIVTEARAGRVFISGDTQHDARSAHLYDKAYAPLEVRAHVNVPANRDGAWVASLCAVARTPRVWQPRETRLIETVTERLWNAVETLRLRAKESADAASRAAAEAALHRHSELIRNVNDNTSELIFMKDRAGRLTYANAATLRAIGRSALPAETIETFSVTAEYDAIAANDERVMQSGRVVEVEEVFTSPDGRRRTFLSTKTPLWEATGEIVGVIGVSRDITERKEAEQALRDSYARFDIVKNAAQVGFWFCDLPFDKLIWDDRVKEHFWLTPDAAVTIETFYERLHPDDRERTRLAIEASIAGHTPYGIEYRTLSDQGAQKWIRAIGRTFYDTGGQPIRFDGVTLDITDRKQAEDDLRENDRRKDEFLAMLAHELRNPLAPILNAVQVLKLTAPGDNNLVWAREVIERQTQHLTRLVDDLLDVSRITQRKITLQRETLDVATIIDRAVEVNRPQADARRQRLEITRPPAPVQVAGDSTRLVQVVSNLLNNAVKYTHQGGRIVVECTSDAGDAVVR